MFTKIISENISLNTMELSLRNDSYSRNECRVIGVHYSLSVFRALIISK